MPRPGCVRLNLQRQAPQKKASNVACSWRRAHAFTLGCRPKQSLHRCKAASGLRFTPSGGFPLYQRALPLHPDTKLRLHPTPQPAGMRRYRARQASCAAEKGEVSEVPATHLTPTSREYSQCRAIAKSPPNKPLTLTAPLAAARNNTAKARAIRKPRITKPPQFSANSKPTVKAPGQTGRRQATAPAQPHPRKRHTRRLPTTYPSTRRRQKPRPHQGKAMPSDTHAFKRHRALRPACNCYGTRYGMAYRGARKAVRYA